jgi:tetratricopeptide (TPR) repeat protein
MCRQVICLLAAFFPVLSGYPRTAAQTPSSSQVQVAPPARRVEPPAANATAEELERRGDELRGEKNNLDALDYFRAALAKKPNDSQIYNKMGIVELQMLHFKPARKDFERAIKADRTHADAINNLGVVYYQMKKYGRAINLYNQAIAIREETASYYSNLGAAYFAKKEYEKATVAYARALQLDPEVFERISRTGVELQQLPLEDRARYDYVMAKLYAKMGMADRSLQYLRKAMEEGYKDIQTVYKDVEFSELRKDPRFTELMAAKPPSIPE